MSDETKTVAPLTNAKPETRPLTPFVLRCPCCNEEKASFALFLGNLGDGEEMQCQECDHTVNLDDVRDLIDRWSVFLAWLALLPAGKG
ncbi:MAG: hypothetical protein E6G97_18330 [Alphaproteobacteria bacterium]|nr:MAG: hypothetical protein E6G97_18330 [Alphaproteobacteria bacterium]